MPENIIKSNRLVTLKYRDSKSLEKILKLFLENTDYLFWKKSDIFIILNLFNLRKEKAHLNKKGLTDIVNLIYDLPNNYKQSQMYWLDLIKKLYENKK